jgi:hypothetical protein
LKRQRVSPIPGERFELSSPLRTGDFEPPASLNPRNELAHPYSSKPSPARPVTDSSGHSFASPFATSDPDFLLYQGSALDRVSLKLLTTVGMWWV